MDTHTRERVRIAQIEINNNWNFQIWLLHTPNEQQQQQKIGIQAHQKVIFRKQFMAAQKMRIENEKWNQMEWNKNIMYHACMCSHTAMIIIYNGCRNTFTLDWIQFLTNLAIWCFFFALRFGFVYASVRCTCTHTFLLHRAFWMRNFSCIAFPLNLQKSAEFLGVFAMAMWLLLVDRKKIIIEGLMCVVSSMCSSHSKIQNGHNKWQEKYVTNIN